MEEANIQVKYSKDISKQEETDVSIERNAGKLELTFNKYCEEFPLFRAISHSHYDKNTRTLSFPDKQENNLLSVLKDSKVTYKFTSAKQKAIKDKYSKQKSLLKQKLGKIKVTKKYKDASSKKQNDNESDNEVTEEEMDQNANEGKNQNFIEDDDLLNAIEDDDQN